MRTVVVQLPERAFIQLSELAEAQGRTPAQMLVALALPLCVAQNELEQNLKEAESANRLGVATVP